VSTDTFVEGYVTSQNGLSLYYRDYGPKYGAAIPVLCLHGLTRNCRDFDIFAKSLMDKRRVICPDIRGHGNSDRDKNWRNYHPSVYVDDVRHIISALNLKHVFVVGTSMGGIMAMIMGVVMPTAIVGVLINDVGPDIDDHGLDNIISYVNRADQVFKDWDAAASFLKASFPHAPAMDSDEWLRVARRTGIERPDGTVINNWDPGITKSLKKQRRGTALWGLFRSLKRIPVVVVRGFFSDILSGNTLLRMQDILPRMHPVIVPESGHAPTLSEPQVWEPLNDALAKAESANSWN